MNIYIIYLCCNDAFSTSEVCTRFHVPNLLKINDIDKLINKF